MRKILEEAYKAMEHAYAPYSQYHVGACVKLKDGRYIPGANVENAAYGSTICAERTALVKAVSEGRQMGFVALAIAGQGDGYCWPCGSCRQMLCEFAPDLKILAANEKGDYQKTTLQELLPHFFGPHSLS